MATVQDTGNYLVFGWPSEDAQGGIRDLLGVVEDLKCPWALARITDLTEIMENGDWEWTVDFIEAVSQDTLEPVGAWWVDPNGSWRVFDGKYEGL